MHSSAVQDLLAALTAYSGSGSFNQYRDVDALLDLPDGAGIRRRNLALYLETFAGAHHLLVGEAAGYAGCRFSGIPFTSEEQLVGQQPLPWTAGLPVARSSAAEFPWRERSAATVWSALGARRDCVLWNAFPWHPCGDHPLSNRTPGSELLAGLEALRLMLALFPAAQVCAVGRTAQRALYVLGIEAPYIRHPSHGGQAAFTAGVRTLFAGTP